MKLDRILTILSLSPHIFQMTKTVQSRLSDFSMIIKQVHNMFLLEGHLPCIYAGNFLEY